ncbi:DUF2147 domain-containing protein [Xanthobacter versatilis]|uniref:DUF2147 domain-containing protein n=1 Tax=Xanthobacter autotrophicus (strain ATCC BAA-1158 / Py2) TaxID=78245 RepID=UPI003726B9FB
MKISVSDRARSLRVAALAAATGVGLLSLATAGAADAADALGKFTRPSTGTVVNFYDCGGKLCGKIISVTNPKFQSTVGQLIVNGAESVGSGKWKGNLFDPDTNKTYKGSMTLAGDGLRLEGCVAAVLCSGETWRRTN